MDKQKYTKPLFIIEQYAYNESIAACGFHDVNEPLTIEFGDNLCSDGTDGHKWGGQNGKKGLITEKNPSLETLTLFNDGSLNDSCQYDWGGPSNNIVTGPGGESYGTFANAFYGNSASENIHAPGYMGETFFS